MNPLDSMPAAQRAWLAAVPADLLPALLVFGLDDDNIAHAALNFATLSGYFAELSFNPRSTRLTVRTWDEPNVEEQFKLHPLVTDSLPGAVLWTVEHSYTDRPFPGTRVAAEFACWARAQAKASASQEN